ncbi:MAG: DUF2244 domain-containing protein [Comamonadaceae bacterium]|nr:MAG: DUF2244 domain-containing protein [Comamonadaceae bacterium]
MHIGLHVQGLANRMPVRGRSCAPGTAVAVCRRHVQTRIPDCIMSNHPPGPIEPDREPAPTTGVDSWKLTRNCAIAPITFFCNIAALALVPLLAGFAFWTAGYPMVMFFCACQLVALFAAAMAYALHATDGELIEVQPAHGKVRIEARCGSRQRVLDLDVCWVRLERDPFGSLMLRSGRAELPLGGQLNPSRRQLFAEEFAASLARARRREAPLPPTTDRRSA